MKKKVLFVVVSLLLASMSLSACGSQQTPQPEQTEQTKQTEQLTQTEQLEQTEQTEEVEQIEQPGQIILCNFEQFEPDFQLMRLQNEFGAVNVNHDMNYVKSGKTSAKLQPIGGYASKSNPYVYLQTFSTRFGYDHSDFTKIESFSAWIYNAQEEVRTVDLGVIGEIVNTTTCTRFLCHRYELQSGWNHVTVDLDHSELDLLLDISNVRGIYFGFANAGTRFVEEAPVYYIDDVSLHIAETPFEKREYQFEEGEIADFEWAYQADIMLYKNTKPTSMPEASVVQAADEGLSAPKGERILKVVTKGDEVVDRWPGVYIPQPVMKASGFNEIPTEERGEYVFRFDVYATVPIKLWSTMYAQAGDQEKIEFNPAVGEWTTVEIPFSEVPENILKSPAEWLISWADYHDAEEKVFYLDNFRYEKIL